MPTTEQVVAILDGVKAPPHKMVWQLAVWLGKESTWSQNALHIAVALPCKAKPPVFNCVRR